MNVDHKIGHIIDKFVCDSSGNTSDAKGGQQ